MTVERAQQNIGPSPSGKATDSDSVISKVRILVGQLKPQYFTEVFLCNKAVEAAAALARMIVYD